MSTVDFPPLFLSILSADGREEITRYDVADPSDLVPRMKEVVSYLRNGTWLWNTFDVEGNGAPSSILAESRASIDVFHGGLGLGLGGLPRLLRFVQPTWMYGLAAPPNTESTSWRVSLCSCLVRAEVLRQIGGPREGFRSLEAAGLDWGLRCLRAGAVLRYTPRLVPSVQPRSEVSLPVEDEVRFLHSHYGTRWALWALFRAWRRREYDAADVRKGLQEVWRLRRQKNAKAELPCYRRAVSTEVPKSSPKVTVLIPTLDRYPYLETLLGQLEEQTVPPHEVIVVDQTGAPRRRRDLARRYPKLNLRWLVLEKAGQCSARNMGLRHANGEWILFLDDDVEVPPEFLERHLRVAEGLNSDSVSGTVYEPTQKAGHPVSEGRIRCSDVFPTNTTLLRRQWLATSGLFDLTYDHGQRADGDLGIRLYLSGALMVLDESNCILHHHAPRGGLRAHGARVVTRAAARRSLWKRNLPSPWDFYLTFRYFGPDAAREVAAIAVLQTFFTGGGCARRVLRAVIGFLQLPSTMAKVRVARRAGERLAAEGPKIPFIRFVELRLPPTPARATEIFKAR